MEISLKNIKHAAFASQETDCFEASVYIDGKRAGYVSNDGHGGSNNYFPPTLYKTLLDYCDTIPPDMAGYRVSPDEIIGNLFDSWRLKKICKGKTLFRIPGREYKTGEWNVMNAPFSPGLRSMLTNAHGSGIEFLNDMAGGAR